MVICGSMIFSKEMVKLSSQLKKLQHEVILSKNVEEYVSGKLIG